MMAKLVDLRLFWHSLILLKGDGFGDLLSNDYEEKSGIWAFTGYF
jgi:hypothetical protein